MNAIQYREIPPKKFEGEGVKGVEGRVAIGKQTGAENFCMRVFEVQPGGFTPRHAHDWEHEIFIHSGQGEAFANGNRSPFAAGDALFIPANEEHQIRNTGRDVLVFLCLIPSKAPEI